MDLNIYAICIVGLQVTRRMWIRFKLSHLILTPSNREIQLGIISLAIIYYL